MGKMESNSMDWFGIVSIVVGLIIVIGGLVGVSNAFFDSNYVMALGFVAFILGSILTLTPRVSKKHSIVGAVSSLLLLVVLFASFFLIIEFEVHSAALANTISILGLISITAFVVFGSLVAIKVAPVSREDNEPSENWWLLFFGEYQWEKYLFWVVGILFIILSCLSVMGVGNGYFINWQDSLIIGLLSLALGYLSDLRYRLFPEVRTD